MPSACVRCRQGGVNFKNKSFKWKKVFSWSLIDFSNSIILMVNAGIYPTYAKDFVFTSYDKMVNSQMIINIVLSLLVIIISPPLGALTDIMYFRVALTAISSIIYSAATMCYYPIVLGSESLWMAMHFISQFFFRISESVTGAYLPSLCTDKDVGFVSSFGYFIGFLAGIVVILLFKLLVAVNIAGLPPQLIMPTINKTYSTAMLTVGIIMLLSSIPPILMMDNGIPKGEKRPKWQWKFIADSFKQNGRTFKTAFRKENKYVALILIDYFIMSIPIQAIGSFAGGLVTQFGAPYGITKELWQTSLLVYNGGVAFSSLVCGFISKFVSAKILIAISYVLVVLANIVSSTWHLIPYDFETHTGPNPAYAWLWVTTAVMSIAFGPIQALLRGLIGLLAKEEQKNEIFGVLESMVILGSLIGSTAPGLLAKMGTMPFGVFCTVLFAVGFILFMFVPVMKAEKEAHERLAKLADQAKLEGADIIVGASVEGEKSSSSSSESESVDIVKEKEKEESSSSSSSSVSNTKTSTTSSTAKTPSRSE